MGNTTIMNASKHWGYLSESSLWEIMFQAFFAGCLGVAAMTLLMSFFSKLHMSEADMVLAVGSFVSKRLEGAFWVGLFLHSVAGIVFAMIYGSLLGLVPADRIGALPAMGVGLGVVHGIVFSAILITTISDWHPLERFQNPKVDEALAHVVGHCIFGCTIGFCYLFYFTGSIATGIEQMAQEFNLLVVVAFIFIACLYLVFKLHDAADGSEISEFKKMERARVDLETENLHDDADKVANSE